MKIKFTLLKIRKKLNLGKHQRKKNPCKNLLFFLNKRNQWQKFQVNRSNFRHWSLKGFKIGPCYGWTLLWSDFVMFGLCYGGPGYVRNLLYFYLAVVGPYYNSLIMVEPCYDSLIKVEPCYDSTHNGRTLLWQVKTSNANCSLTTIKGFFRCKVKVGHNGS